MTPHWQMEHCEEHHRLAVHELLKVKHYLKRYDKEKLRNELDVNFLLAP